MFPDLIISLLKGELWSSCLWRAGSSFRGGLIYGRLARCWASSMRDYLMLSHQPSQLESQRN